MAGPITHIVLSDKVFDTHFSNKDKKAFYLGTSFPDIRYMGVIEREKTHFGNLTIEYLQSLPAFEAGLKFHSLIDEVRERYVVSRKIYSLLPESPYVSQAIKFYEDKLLYEKRQNWNEIGEYLKEVLPEETAFGIEEENIKTWHHFLTQYTQQPSDDSIRYFVQAVKRPAAMADEIIRLTHHMAQNPQFNEIVTGLYQHFESLL